MTIKSKKLNPNSSFLILISLMLLGIGLRFYGLNHVLGHGDENEVLMYFVYNPLSLILTALNDSNHHIFHTILLHFMAKWFGDLNEYAIRAPAFISGISALWFVYKVSQKIFASPWVARFSLLIMAFSPVHIYFSQTARGYSLNTFLSILMVYILIRFLESGGTAWAFLLTICGFLITYTIPTSSFFVFALGIWAAYVAISPEYSREFNLESNQRWKRFSYTLFLFFCMAVLSLLAYLPILKEMFETAEYIFYTRMPYSSRIDLIINFFPNLLKRFFQDSFIFFTPFIIIGLLKAKPVRKSYKTLFLFVLSIVYLILIITFKAWHPRSYLFILPIATIFLAAGMVYSIELLIKRFPTFSNQNGWFLGIIVFYILFSFKWLIPNYYNSINLESGKEYLEFVNTQTQSHDLIVVGNSANFLYLRSRYFKNLENIFSTGKIHGIKFITSNSKEFQEMSLPGRGQAEMKGFPVFKNFFNSGIKKVDMPLQKQLYDLTEKGDQSILGEDFETNGNFIGKQGKGNLKLDEDHVLSGNNSLAITSNSKENFIIAKPISKEIEIKNDSLAVLIWGEKHKGDEFKFPLLRINLSKVDLPEGIPMSFRTVKPFIIKDSEVWLRTGFINNGKGMKLFLYEQKNSRIPWGIRAMIGKIPPGRYNANIEFLCPKGKTINYDGVRLFFIEKIEENGQPL